MSDATPVYLVFGAYGGVGEAVSRRLAGTGGHLALSGRDPAKLEPLAAELNAVAFDADATDFDAVEHVVTEVVSHFGRLDGVTNCVGSLLLKPAHMTRASEWNETLAVNLTSAFAVLRASVKPMMKQKSGAVVLTSTAAASHGLPNHEAIAAAKGGIDALVRSAAATYGRSGIRVNAVAPGLVETPLTARISANENARSASLAMHALGRLGTAEDVSAAMHWLLSDDATWVTGQTLGVDGGLSRTRAS